MNTNIPQNQEDQEIDLLQISKKIGQFFDGINTRIFKCIQFFIKNRMVILILVLVGFGLGMYLDTTKNTYNNQIIVSPNFGSTDYLYSKINLIQSKINEGDTVFLKETLGIKKPKEILKIEIKPIIDVYKFVQNRNKNFEVLKLISEKGDINEIIKNDITSKNYPYHIISFNTDKQTSYSETIEPILKYLNNSEYYTKIQKVYESNIKNKIVQNDSIINQINRLLKGFSNTVKGSQKSNSLVYYNENTQLNDIIKTKDQLITEQGSRKLELVDYDEIIKDISITVNSKNFKGINGKLKLVLPVLFLLLFILINLFKTYYKKQTEKLKNL